MAMASGSCMPTLAAFLLLHSFIILCQGAPSSDLVRSLPGQPSPPAHFNQYAGYVTVDPQAGRALFYYLVEAPSDNAPSKPLTLWLNGGPRCGSFGDGAFAQIGPFRLNGNKLIRNKFAWNRESNLLFLDSPAGVGFSYSNDTTFYTALNDATIAQDTFQFLLYWFAKFPEYMGRDFYITGQSYGGHHIPLLATLVRKFMQTNGNAIINLKAISIGNPLLDTAKDWTAATDFLWSHGLINDETLKKVHESCDWAVAFTQYAHNRTFPAKCVVARNESDDSIGEYIDEFDVLLDVCLFETNSQKNMAKRKLTEQPQYSLGQDVCLGSEMKDYFNRVDVQNALHVHTSNSSHVQWTICSSQINYEFIDILNNSVSILRDLITHGLRVLIYSGDQDSIIPLISTRTLIDELAKDLQLDPKVAYSAWYARKQVAGWTEGYGGLNLTYATVRGGSHRVPPSQPTRALTLFEAFIQNQALPSKP